MNDEERLEEELQEFMKDNPADYNAGSCLLYIVLFILAILVVFRIV